MAGSSLLLSVGLIGLGFILGRAPLVSIALEIHEELLQLPPVRKGGILAMIAFMVFIYVIFILLPLRWIATDIADRDDDATTSTSFRRELRRRGSFSMSYVTDIKSHVLARPVG